MAWPAYCCNKVMLEINENFYGDKKFVSIDIPKIPEYYQKNPIEGHEQFLGNSIDTFGVKAPLVINTNPERYGMIINGVEIYKECLNLGLTEVPVWEVELDFEEEKALHVALNTHTSEVSQEQVERLLNSLESKLFPSAGALTSNHAVDRLSKKEIRQAKSQALFRSTTFRYLPLLDEKINHLKSATACNSLNQLLSKLITDAVERGWYD